VGLQLRQGLVRSLVLPLSRASQQAVDLFQD
jgi:hypothetical protein